MSALVNIGGSNNAHDRSYRYKRPRVATKIEGRGNGIKTVITNMSDIGRALNTNPTYPTKYFGCELGAQSKYDEKTGFATVNGAFDAPDLDKMLEGFISGFVLCPKCALPETKLKVGRNELITADCSACGYNGSIPGQAHKVVTYIARNPPGSKKLKSSQSKKDLKREKKAAAAAAAAAAENGDDTTTTTATEDGDEGELDDDNGPPAAGDATGVSDSVVDGEVLLGAPELSGAGGEAVIAENDDEVEWSVDTSKEAKKERRELLLAGGAASEGKLAASMSMTSLTSASVQGGNTTAAIRMLEPLIGGGTAPDADVIAAIKRVSVAESLTAVQKVIIMWEALFAMDGVVAAKAAKARVAVVRTFVKNADTQLQLLNCMELHVTLLRPEQLPHTQAFLMLFYDEEIVPEDVIKSWFSGPPSPGVEQEHSAKVRAAAEGFMNWLDEAEEESSDDEE